MVRVRFAPSPTGYLHVGNARTAILNYLFVKKMKGTFILRIEDTDVERSRTIFIESIISDLSWLGINFDEGPYLQSKRIEIYRGYAERLINEGFAYKCFCSKERLRELRKEMEKIREPPRYDGTCRNLSESERKRLELSGKPYVIRFLAPNRAIEFRDLIFGSVKFPAGYVDDFVLIKGNGTPSYNFAAAIDDMVMGITHVIRGKDHISNTPKQILIFKVFGKEHPQYAHHPLLVGKDGRPLSKREGSNEIKSLKENGILPEAILNFLGVLGRRVEKEVMDLDELISSFSLESISRSDAIFDVEKLLWFNKQHLRRLPSHEIMKKAEIEEDPKIVELLRDNAGTLKDLKEMLGIFRSAEITKDGVDYLKGVKEIESIVKILEESLLTDSLSFSSMVFRLKERGIHLSKENLLALRVLITGRKEGPPLDTILGFIPKSTILGRIECYKRSS